MKKTKLYTNLIAMLSFVLHLKRHLISIRHGISMIDYLTTEAD